MTVGGRIKMFMLRWSRRMLVIGPFLLAGSYWASRTEAPALVDGVRREVRQFTLDHHSVSVSLFYPANKASAPVVVVAHGFTRSKRYMAGWGGALAAEGFIAAVLTQPTLANHEVNARAIADLVTQLNAPIAGLRVKPTGRTAVMGHSMGGLTTFLAAAKRPVEAWIGLDPVGMSDTWLMPARMTHMPCLVLRAEPSAWNLDGNARALFSNLSGPKLSMKIKGSGHLDPEYPTDVLGQIACGRADVGRRAVFERYAIAFARAFLMDDAAAKEKLRGAADDPALVEVENQLE